MEEDIRTEDTEIKNIENPTENEVEISNKDQNFEEAESSKKD